MGRELSMPFRSLWPLPGGHGHFLATLVEIVGWVDAREKPSTLELFGWMRQQYRLAPDAKTPNGYIQLVTRMGYLVSDRSGQIAASGCGRLLLTSQGPDRVKLVTDALMSEWLGVYDVLAEVNRLGVTNGTALLRNLSSRFPSWTSTAQYEWRLQWLHSLGYLEKAEGGYIVTKQGHQAFGLYKPIQSETLDVAKTSSGQLTVVQSEESDYLARDDSEESADGAGETFVDGELPLAIAMQDEAERLAEKLKRTALESDDATAFELAIAESFRFLGFNAEHRSGAGDTDVLVLAPLGQETYSAVVDGKSSRHGKVTNHQIDWLALTRHKDSHRVDYILVVAPNFSSGDLLDNASKTSSALISSDDLAAVIRLHASTPLSLADLRELFRYAGHPELPLQRIQEKAAEVARLQRLLPDVLRIFESSYRAGVAAPIAADALHLILAHDYGRAIYSKDEICAALDLLCTPLVGAVRRVTDTAYALQMPIVSVGRRFRAQARQLMEAAEIEAAATVGGRRVSR